ncbi:hypothetical protein C4568_00585 [Candidatus Parcubacteria bacterium]|nr:MAG: hypothetical protein C4568_00585 [Candidatus Parcubacteria bacterium]
MEVAMDVNAFADEMRRLKLAGYELQPEGKKIRLQRGGVLFCPLAAMCDLYERETWRGRWLRWSRRFRARFCIGRAHIVDRGLEELGPVSWAHSWASRTLRMDMGDQVQIVRAADAWDLNSANRYDRATREAMTRFFIPSPTNH